MKPGPVEYRAPASLDEALELLATHGDEARVLAGGQSLMPMLNMRLSRPGLLVDLNRVDELSASSVTDEALTIGAMVRQRDAELSAEFHQRLPILRESLQLVGHVTTRHRGTIGGSICHADPAAELPALAVFTDATVTLRSQRGTRELPASEFFSGFFTTELASDEMLTALTLPRLEPGAGAAICEFTRRSHEFAIAGVLAALGRTSSDRITSCRLLAFGVNGELARLADAEKAMVGETYGSDLVDDVAATAMASLTAIGDVVASPAYRLQLVRVLCKRALDTAYQRGVPTDE